MSPFKPTSRKWADVGSDDEDEEMEGGAKTLAEELAEAENEAAKRQRMKMPRANAAGAGKKNTFRVGDKSYAGESRRGNAVEDEADEAMSPVRER